MVRRRCRFEEGRCGDAYAQLSQAITYLRAYLPELLRRNYSIYGEIKVGEDKHSLNVDMIL